MQDSYYKYCAIGILTLLIGCYNMLAIDLQLM